MVEKKPKIEFLIKFIKYYFHRDVVLDTPPQRRGPSMCGRPLDPGVRTDVLRGPRCPCPDTGTSPVVRGCGRGCGEGREGREVHILLTHRGGGRPWGRHLIH